MYSTFAITVAQLAAVAALAAASDSGDLTVPAWDFVPAHVDKCIDATAAGNPDNARWATYAVPVGMAPPGGWPVYLDLVTDTYPVLGGATCGNKGARVRKTYPAFATPQQAMASCFSNQTELTSCSAAMAAGCASAAKSGGLAGCMECAKATGGPIATKSCNLLEAFGWCEANAGGHKPYPPSGGCGYDQEAGVMWDHRLKQYLLSNGVAVINANPIEEDSWDAFELAWNGYIDNGSPQGGVDKPWLTELFNEIKTGNLGPLDTNKVVIRGWSSGAQMVSWLMQVIANDTAAFPQMKMAGGVMLSGGSYQCYNDAQGDPKVDPIGSCKQCTEGGPSHCQGDPKCNSCDATVKPYCQQCCPKNYTEQYYADHPEAYATHPPVFLAQTSTVDNHADLCACKNYHETLQAHNVKSVLELVPEEDESCFCVGNPKNPASAGSPFASRCSDPSWGQNCGLMGGKDCCISHTFGFASMIEPAVTFIKEVTAN